MGQSEKSALYQELKAANVQFDKGDATSEEIKQVKIDLYTERMKFTYKGA